MPNSKIVARHFANARAAFDAANPIAAKATHPLDGEISEAECKEATRIAASAPKSTRCHCGRAAHNDECEYEGRF